jgi:hypothetical protein
LDTSLKQRKNSTVSVVRLFLWITLFINGIPAIVGLKNAWGLGSFFGFSGSMLLVLWPCFLISFICLLGLILQYSRHFGVVDNLIKKIVDAISRLRGFGIILFFILLLLLTYCFLFNVSLPLVGEMPVISLFGNLGLLGAVILSGTRKMKPALSLMISFSIISLLLVIVSYVPEINSYPFSMDWSEATRFYDASLFFSSQIYGKSAPLPALDPTRAFLQALPFLISSLPIWIHRLWRVMLWLGITFLAAQSLVKRVKLENRWLRFGLFAWFTIFSFQGPVYFHLMVVVIIVLLAFDRNRLGRSMIFVGLASLWAGVSRVNWFPVAGMLAAVLYILEVPQGVKKFWQYWGWPVMAVILGLALAFGAQTAYLALSGNPAEYYVTSFNSSLLWYRLFPSEAYGQGVIVLMLTASLPLWLIAIWCLVGRTRAWRTLRLLALLSILLALMTAGLIVSTKIGGGNNLHNLDSYLMILAVIVTYIVFNRFEVDDLTIETKSPVPILLFVLVFLAPMIKQGNNLHPYQVMDNEKAWENVRIVQDLIDNIDPEDGEVLFIQNRHLLPLDLIKNIELVPEYEKVFLMEMAMSENEDYLNEFQTDLKTHRFALIIMEPINLIIQTSSDAFGEENNAWVESVAQPLSESYHTVLDLSENGMIIMAPNK